jgi:hypothetical protein
LASETSEEPIAFDATDEGTQGALPASPSFDVAMATVRDFKSMKAWKWEFWCCDFG